jgi:hypothetical protein
VTRSIEHQIEIDATPAAVWAELTDTAAYGEWNPFVRRLSGELSKGSRLVVEIAPPGGHAMTFKPTVLVVEPERELRWLGRLGLPGIFDGEHSFRLEPLPQGRTRLVQAELFRGVLVGLFGGTLEKTRLGFAQMDDALKQRVEAAIQ